MNVSSLIHWDENCLEIFYNIYCKAINSVRNGSVIEKKKLIKSDNKLRKRNFFQLRISSMDDKMDLKVIMQHGKRVARWASFWTFYLQPIR